MPQNKRKSRKRQLQASHQKNWLTGRYAVLEALRAGTWPVTELFVAEDLPDVEWQEVHDLVDSADFQRTLVSRDRLAELCGSSHHQGLAARMGDFPYGTVESLLQQVDNRKLSSETDAAAIPLLVICDRIQDSHNLGAILRCGDAMHVDGVIIGETDQAGVTPQVARSSAGAVNHVPIAVAPDLLAAARILKTAGYEIAAATEKSPNAVWAAELTSPLALVVGSEALGISSALAEECTQHLSIPMLGQCASLNAAVAAGILLYEIRRQQMSNT